ncbi:MAG: SDR family NAD(P)-dependent oxidoreductase [Comamonadaceae bacterium]|nr:MAG: SDR family NAD(P)-dependent oxidoreductase [Comamonadaceae bacterium]
MLHPDYLAAWLAIRTLRTIYQEETAVAESISQYRVAIVTGAGRGMGRAHALALSDSGCRVVVNDRDAEAAEMVAHEIAERGGTAVHNAYDDVASPEELVAHAINSYGQLDIVVNNAGALGTTLSPIPPRRTVTGCATCTFDRQLGCADRVGPIC